MALEGVGPSMALGIQEQKGNCADFAAADKRIDNVKNKYSQSACGPWAELCRNEKSEN